MAVEKRFIITRRPSPSLLRTTLRQPPPPETARSSVRIGVRRTALENARESPPPSTAASSAAAAADTTAVTAARALTQPDNRRVVATAGSSTLADRPYVASLVCSPDRSVRLSRLVRVPCLRICTDWCAYFGCDFVVVDFRFVRELFFFRVFKPRSCCVEIKTKKSF